MGDYHKLDVWKLGCEVSDQVDEMCERLPRRVQARLGDQLIRAAESIHLNIAEGCGLNSDSQLARHLRIALGSANELEDGLAKLHRRGLLTPADESLVPTAQLLRKKLGAFLKVVSARAAPR